MRMPRLAVLLLVSALTTACTETPGARGSDASTPGIDAAATTDAATADAAATSETSAGDSAPPKLDSAPPKLDSAPPKPDSAPPKLDGAPPSGVVLRVTFDKAPLGQYTDSAIKSEWKWIKWSSGLKEGRVHIVEGAQSKSGRSLRIFYPKNTYGPGPGGAQWWVTLPQGYNELYCAYWVKFGSGFDFVKGGKIPGLLGGAGNTGGDKPDGTDGWSARMMWRKGGEAVQYVYHPDQPTIYGEDMAWDIGGTRVFSPGTWVRVEHRIVMNTPKQKDGIVEGWWNGVKALSRKNIRFRDVNTFAIDGFYFSTFFGGGDSSWSSTKDEYVYFDDFIIATKPITH